MNTRTIALAAVLTAALSVAAWRLYSGNRDATEGNTSVGTTLLPTSTHNPGDAHMIQADFNGDNLIDRAVAETDSLGRNRISIYLRRDTKDPLRQYYKIGHIQNPGEFAASAIMSVQGNDGNYLIVILSHSDGTKEMVHYRSQGEIFVEVQRESLGDTHDR